MPIFPGHHPDDPTPIFKGKDRNQDRHADGGHHDGPQIPAPPCFFVLQQDQAIREGCRKGCGPMIGTVLPTARQRDKASAACLVSGRKGARRAYTTLSGE